MAEKRNDTSPGEEDAKPDGCAARNCLVACLPFAAGLAAALVIGWWLYPDLLFAKRHQPVSFNHQAHLVKLGMACSDCHTLRDDGSFRGLPTTAECATCHSLAQSDSPREKKLIDGYVAGGRELPWRVRQKQPANVYFSHAAHSVDNCNSCHDFATAELCSLCHVDVAGATHSLPVFENRLTGYSAATMKMDRCESCHAHPKHLNDSTGATTSANNACFVCHK